MRSFSSLPLFAGLAAAAIFEMPDGMQNMDVYVSDNVINWGDVNPVDVMRQLFSECDVGGCNPSFEVSTNILDAIPMPHTITVSIQNNYEGWAKNGLATIHELFMQSLMDHEGSVRDEEYQNRICGGMGFCSSTTESIVQHYAPERINVRGKDDDLQIGWDVNIESIAAETGMCGIATSIGSAFGGAVNGALGGVFGIAALICETSGVD